MKNAGHAKSEMSGWGENKISVTLNYLHDFWWQKLLISRNFHTKPSLELWFFNLNGEEKTVKISDQQFCRQKTQRVQSSSQWKLITTLYNDGEQQNGSNPVAIQQQRTTSGSSPVNQEQKPEAAAGTSSPGLGKM